MNENEETEQRDEKQGTMIWRIVLAIAITLFVLGMLLPSVGGPRSAGRRSMCQSNLKWIALGILSYQQQHGYYPQAPAFAENGTPRSWRVEILPQLEQQALRNQYNDDQPWDSQANLQIAETQLPIFQCESARLPASISKTFKTNYVLITGPRSAFPTDQRVSASDIRDGCSNTIIMLEINNSDIAWTEPRDLTIGEAIALFNRPEVVRRKHPTNHKGGRMVAFADGHAEFAKEDTPPDVLRALFTIDDGIAVSLNSLR